jgi:hypothetical protein
VDLLTTITPIAALLTDTVFAAPPPKGIPGVEDTLNTFFGWVLWVLSAVSLIALLILFGVGYESYKHNQAEAFMEKAKAWVLAAVLGANAHHIVGMFFPGMQFKAVATAIPGLTGPVSEVIGIIIWILGWAAFACVLILAVRGFLAYRNDSLGEFVGKFFWFIVASLGISFVSPIAGAFFPAALSFG